MSRMNPPFPQPSSQRKHCCWATGMEAVCQVLCPNPKLMADFGDIPVDPVENTSDWLRMAAAAGPPFRPG